MVFAERFRDDIHVIGTVDTSMLKNECYQRRPYPVVGRARTAKAASSCGMGIALKTGKTISSSIFSLAVSAGPWEMPNRSLAKSSYRRSGLRGHSAKFPPAPAK